MVHQEFQSFWDIKLDSSDPTDTFQQIKSSFNLRKADDDACTYFGSHWNLLFKPQYKTLTAGVCHLSAGESLCAGLLKLLMGGSEVPRSAVLGEAVDFPQSHARCLLFRCQDSLAWTLSQQLTVTDTKQIFGI